MCILFLVYYDKLLESINSIKCEYYSNVSLGKFGTFHSNGIIGRPFGHSYEIYDNYQVKVIKNVAFYEVGKIIQDSLKIIFAFLLYFFNKYINKMKRMLITKKYWTIRLNKNCLIKRSRS